MNTVEARKPTEPTDKKSHPDTGPEVTIRVNDNSVEIHRGRQLVSDIKSKAGVPQADELEQVIEGRLTPLGDADAVTLKGGEVFISHVRDGQSS